MTKIAVSILTIQGRLIDIIKKLEQTDADYFHIDIMDGKFVPNRSFTFGEIKKLSKYTTKKLDVHLMVDNPIKYIEDYATLDLEYLTFHYEAVKDPELVIESIQNYGLKVGLSINPKTKVSKIKPLLPLVDQVLVMSVEPGKGGQQFLENSLEKITELNELRLKNNYNYIISVDGGINSDNSHLIKELGVDLIVVGAYICLKDNYQEAINELR